MEKYVVEEIVKERIRNNSKNFNADELHFIENNTSIVTKIYLIGSFDAKTSVSKSVSNIKNNQYNTTNTTIIRFNMQRLEISVVA